MTDKQQLVIEANTREINGKQVRGLRAEGFIPAVLYGHGVPTKQLTVAKKDFDKIYRVAGESTIVLLKVGPETAVNVLIHEIQRDNVSDLISHIDFYQVKMTEKLTATVPLKFIGVPSAVKELGGTLMHPMSEVEVKSLPADLPHEIEVDVSGLSGFDQVVRVSDLKVDRSKVEILVALDTAVAMVKPPRTEEELKELETAPVEVDVTTVEGVEKKETEPGAEEAEVVAETEAKKE